MSGAKAFGYFALFKVTRRQGGTLSGRYRRNGYVHPQKSMPPATPPSRASSLPQVTASAETDMYTRKNTSPNTQPSRAGTLPHGIEDNRKISLHCLQSGHLPEITRSE